MKYRSCFLPAIAAISCALVSCTLPATHCPYTLSSDYAKADLSNRKMMLILPGDSAIVINNKSDVEDDFGGTNATPESRIRKFYFPEFVKAFKSQVGGDSVLLPSEVKPGLTQDSLGMHPLTLRTGTDSLPLAYSIPDKARMQTLGLSGSIAVIIERIEFKRNAFHSEYYWDEKTRKLASLQADVHVLIWDCKSEAPIFYGTLTSTIEFHFSLLRKHWDESAEDLAKKMVMTAKCI